MRVLAAPLGDEAQSNPYLSALYDEVRQRGIQVDGFSRRAALTRADIIHIHWPELLITWDRGRAFAAWEATKVLLILAAARALGTKIVWTGHNLEPHDIPYHGVFNRYLAVLGRLLSAVITLSDEGGHALRERYPWLASVPMTTIRHGHYRSQYPARVPREVARRGLGLAPLLHAPAVLVFGQLRRYKQQVPLVEAFVRYGQPCELIIAGSPQRDPALAAEIAQLASGVDSVVLRLAFLSAEDASLLHSAADVVLLPYDLTSSLNSGSALLALSLDLPVVMVDAPAARELQALVGEDWVLTASGSMKDLIDVAYARSTREPVTQSPDLSAFDSGRIGSQTAALYDSVGRRGRRAGGWGSRGHES